MIEIGPWLSSYFGEFEIEKAVSHHRPGSELHTLAKIGAV